jgi:hypothetical protein
MSEGKRAANRAIPKANPTSGLLRIANDRTIPFDTIQDFFRDSFGELKTLVNKYRANKAGTYLAKCENSRSWTVAPRPEPQTAHRTTNIVSVSKNGLLGKRDF